MKQATTEHTEEVLRTIRMRTYKRMRKLEQAELFPKVQERLRTEVVALDRALEALWDAFAAGQPKRATGACSLYEVCT